MVAILVGTFSPAGEQPPEVGPFAPSTTQFDFARGLLSRQLCPEAAQEFSSFLKDYANDPRVPQAVLWRGEAYFSQDDYQKASIDFYTYLTKYKTEPKQDFARLRYGCSLFELGQYKQAVPTMQPLTASTVRDTGIRQSALYYLGLSHAALKDPARALAALEQVTTGPLAPDAQFERGEVLSSMGKHTDAAETFASFIKTYPEHKRLEAALLRQGEELRIAGRLQDAAGTFLSLIKKAGENRKAVGQARYGLGWVRYSQGNYTASRDLAAQVAANRESRLDIDACYLQGLSALRLKDYKTATNAFGRVSKGPYHKQSAVKLAWAFLGAGDYDGALRAVERAFRDFKLERGELDYIAGKAHQQKKNLPQALQSFAMARNAKAGYHAESALELAHTYGQLGKPEQAVDAYSYFIKTFPRNKWVVDALVQQGQQLIALRRHAEALQAYAALLAREDLPDTTREHALGQQAICFYWMKQYANMKAAYEQLIKTFPKSPSIPDALYWLAWYEYQAKQFSNASALYARLVKEYPRHSLASRARYRRAMSLYQDGKEEDSALILYDIILNYPRTPLDQKELLWLGQYYMKRDRFKEAETVYGALLKPERNADREARALAYYFQAESRRRRKDWAGGLKIYERLLAEKDTGLESASHFGRAQCLRHLERHKESREALSEVKLTPDDPLMAHYLSELGHLDFAEKKYASAARHLMRVGLIYDNEALCGEALWTAAEACRLAGDNRKARICLEELAGIPNASFGKRYPKSAWTGKGQKALTTPADPPKNRTTEEGA